MTSVGIVGASGYTGAELLRLCAAHPQFQVKLASAGTQAGTRVGELYPSLAGEYRDAVFDHSTTPDRLDGLDLVFLALPHGESQNLMPEVAGRVGHVVDLAADFRLANPSLYPTWYGEAHRQPELLSSFTYGLPELFRDSLRGASRVAAPGCYVTAATVALAPLLQAGLVEPTGIVVDAASGVSGAGRPPKASTSFCAADEDFSAYGLATHRHTPEIEQALTAAAGRPVQVIFTPHLAPMNRGILATCYLRPAPGPKPPTTAELLAMLQKRWAGEPFVVVTDRPPSTKATRGSNAVHVTAVADPRTGWIVALAALDNLVKGASGQAIQCANLMLGLPEASGLAVAGVYP